MLTSGAWRILFWDSRRYASSIVIASGLSRRPLLFSATILFAAGCLALLSGIAAPAGAASGGPHSLGKFGDWEAFLNDSGGGKVCYAASLPKQSKNAPKGRAEAYAMVSNHPADKSFGVIGITAGFPLKKGASALLEAGGAKFDLYTVDSTAWSRDDKAVVAALGKARSATFVGYPAKGDPVADVYDLGGFAEARAAIDKACK
jgi:hypothetical protein